MVKEHRFSAVENESLLRILPPMREGELTKGAFKDTLQFLQNDMPYGHDYHVRKKCITYSWSVVTCNWLDSMKSLVGDASVLEVCAGHGLVSRLMRRRGCSFHATDLKDGTYPTIESDDVEKLEALEAIEIYKPDIVFVSWIPYTSKLDVELFKTGVPCIVVGEGYYGCTGSTEFWENEDYGMTPMLDVYPKLSDVPQWSGIHDQTFLMNWEEPKP